MIDVAVHVAQQADAKTQRFLFVPGGRGFLGGQGALTDDDERNDLGQATEDSPHIC
ncbi:MAG: hypothetical protein QOD56_817 [Gammaproteobacteria bacterium]|nr:hypothetical protein [Gammaproteobacteria bacterium]